MKALKLTLLTFTFLLYAFLNNSSAQWEPVSNGAGTDYSLAANVNTIFAGTLSFGVYKSANNGASWIQSGLSGVSVLSLAASGSYVFAAKSGGVYRSTDNGVSWPQTLSNSWTFYSLAVSGSYVFAGGGYCDYTCSGIVYRSSNNGLTWEPTSLQPNDGAVISLAASGSYVFAGAVYGVYRSTDYGGTWTGPLLNTESIQSLAISGTNIFAGTYQHGVYRSTDNGGTWAQTPLNNVTVYSLAVNGNNVFAGTAGNGVYVSYDNGGSWTPWNQGLPNNLTVYALCISNNLIFAGTQFYSVYRRALAAPSIPPTLISPPNNSINQPLTPLLVWSRVLAATTYQVRVSWDSLFATTVLDSIRTDTTITVPPGRLDNSLRYFWSARGINTLGYGPWSAVFNFTTTPPAPGPPTLISPPNNSFGISTTPLLDWSTVPTATSYRVQVSEDSTFASLQLDSVTALDSMRVPAGRLINNKRYFWHVRAQNVGGNSAYSPYFIFTTSLVGITNNNEIPKVFKLYTNYPNPFNPVTKIRFALPKSSFATLVVYDALGREVATIVNEQLKPGTYEAEWNAINNPSGVYFYRITAGDFIEAKKMVLIK